MSTGASQGYQAPQPQYQQVADPWSPTPVQQTFTQQAMPDWMKQGSGMTYGQQGANNWFAAPWWGTNAATGQKLGQSDLQAKQKMITKQVGNKSGSSGPVDKSKGDLWAGGGGQVYHSRALANRSLKDPDNPLGGMYIPAKRI